MNKISNFYNKYFGQFGQKQINNSMEFKQEVNKLYYDGKLYVADGFIIHHGFTFLITENTQDDKQKEDIYLVLTEETIDILKELIDAGYDLEFTKLEEEFQLMVNYKYDFQSIADEKYKCIQKLFINNFIQIEDYTMEELYGFILTFPEFMVIQFLKTMFNTHRSYLIERLYKDRDERLFKIISKFQFANMFDVIAFSVLTKTKLSETNVNYNGEGRPTDHTVSTYEFINHFFGNTGTKLYYEHAVFTNDMAIDKDVFDFCFKNSETFRWTIVDELIIEKACSIQNIEMLTQQQALILYSEKLFETVTSISFINKSDKYHNPLDNLLTIHHDWDDLKALITSEPKN